MSNQPIEEFRCLVCQQLSCDVCISDCGCLLHTTCLSSEVLFPNPYANNTSLCPSCQKAPITRISVLPLPVARLEEALLSREQDDGYSSTSSSLFCPLSLDKKRSQTSRCISRTCRTGRWSSEESALVDKLIRAFDSGLLPLPHGIKLNDFLCDLLSCRTSRLTKKLKHEKLSSRSYRPAEASSLDGTSTVSGGTLSTQAGASIQRAQTLFLKTVCPAWLQAELRFNMSRVWRIQLANLSLQIGFRHIDTTDWVESLNAVENAALADTLEAKRKRLKCALSADASAAAKSSYDSSNSIAPEVCTSSTDTCGVFVGGLPVRRQSDLIEDVGLQIDTSSYQDSQSSLARDRFGSLNGSIARESDALVVKPQRKFTFGEEELELEDSMNHISSFASLADLLTTPSSSRRPSKVDPARSDAFPGVLTEDTTQAIDGAIDSIVNDSFTGQENQGKFLQRVSSFLMNHNYDFQHVDLWVPTESECDATEPSGGRTRLTNAGYATIKNSAVPSQVASRLNEFGVYSKSFSFAPGFGMPGRVFSTGQPSWDTCLFQAGPSQFSRSGGAQMYGINTAVGLPIPTRVGTIVVGLYSMSVLNRDAAMEAECMDYFRKLQPVPRWRLSIEIAGNDPQEYYVVPPLLGPAFSLAGTSSACIIPSSPVSTVFEREPSNAPTSQLNEQSLALLLGKYDSPKNKSQVSTNDDPADDLMSLRLLLLRHPSCRTTVQSNQVFTIMSKYQTYVDLGCRETEIVQFIAKDLENSAGANPQSDGTTVFPTLESVCYQVDGPNLDLFSSAKAFYPALQCDEKSNAPRVVSEAAFKSSDS